MFCPNCGFEYRPGFTLCNDCDVDLVDQLPTEAESEEPKEEANNDCVQLLWRGLDGSAFNEIIQALEEAGVRYSSKILEVKITLSSTYAPLEIRVPVTESEEARKILGETLKRIPELVTGENEPTSAIESEESAERPFSANEPNPEDATAEAWSGEKKSIAQFLKSCLVENGIGCYIESRRTGVIAVRILPEHDGKAKEVVRQALEAIPPE